MNATIILIAYILIGVFAYRFAYPHFRERTDHYTTDGEIQFFSIVYGLLWPLLGACHALWALATIGRPRTATEKREEREAAIAHQEREIFRLQVHRADLEHENGYTPTDPPEGWVPKNHSSRYYVVDYRLR